MTALSALTNTTTIADTDELYILDGANSRAITVGALFGALLTSNTETLITVTYQAADATLDFVVNNDLSAYDNTTSNFATVTGTETLTNKTLTTPVITLTNSAGASPTASAVIEYDTTAERIVVGDGAATRSFPSTVDILGKETLIIPASALVPEDGAAGPSVATVAGTNVDYEELLFDGAATETAFFAMASPKSYDVSETVDVIIHYAVKGTSSGNVRWAVSINAIGDGDTIDTAFSAAATDDSSPGAVANVIQPSGTISVTVNGTPAKGDTWFVRIQRIGGTDTNTDDAALIAVEFKPTVDALNDT